MKEVKVGKVHDLKNGEMKEIEVGGTSVLLARIKDEYYAMHAKCTHYGAPLADGALNEETCQVVCPWHHACFDIRTGRHLEAPGLDGLPAYGVRIDGEDVIVTIPNPEADRQPNQKAPYHPNNEEKYLIIGGGAAAAYASEGLREAGFTGMIQVLTKEQDLPYDRPNCSKEYLSDDAKEEWMPLRDKKFYDDNVIRFLTSSKVVRLDADQKEVELENGEKLSYDKVLLCTGGIPVALNIPGIDSDNVYYLRSLTDSKKLKAAGKKEDKVVVIGASFIGMEGAMSLQKLDTEVTVVAPEDVPFAKVFGKEVGQRIQKAHEAAGINFQLGHKVEKIESENGKVSAVILDDGTKVPADLVLVGIGVKPATDYLVGVPKEKDGGIKVDQYLHAGKDVYVAGDIAHFPYHGSSVRIEHWKVACQQGRVAAHNMAGEPKAFTTTPFFWTAQQDLKLQYVGHAEDFDEVHVDGSLEDAAFIAYYRKNGKDVAALGCGRGKEMAALDASGKFSAQ